MLALERGFTLLDVMLSLLFGSVVLLAAARVLPTLRQHAVDVMRHYRLEQVLQQRAFDVEKDLRRAGFCAGECNGQPLMLGHAEGEAVQSCVIIAYDLNRNGRWDSSGTEAEYFGYRLRLGALETQRGVQQCNGRGWERLTDPSEVYICQFIVNKIPHTTQGAWVHFSLLGHSTTETRIQHHLERAVDTNGL